MIKNLNVYLLVFSLFAIITTVNAQRLLPEQENELNQQIKDLLNTYAKNNELSVDGVQIDRDMASRFERAFVGTNRQVIFNDLLPDGEEGNSYLTPSDYVVYAINNYPSGTDVNLEVKNINILGYDSNKKAFEAIVFADKRIRGLYRNRKIHTFSGTIYFYIEAAFENGQIATPRIERAVDNKKHQQIQANIRFGGLYAGLSGGYSQSVLFSTQVLKHDSWSPQLGMANIPSLEIFYMFNRSVGIATGLTIGNYSSGFYLNEYDKQLDTRFTDMDEHIYFPIFDIRDFTETSEIKTLEIPLFLKFRTGVRSVGYYFDLGAIMTSYRSIIYSFNGNVTSKGYYPEWSLTLEDIPEYDYYSNQEISSDSDYQITNSDIGVSAFLSTGLSIGVYKDILLKIGISSRLGLTDVFGSEHPDYPYNFFNTTGNSLGEVLLLSAGVDVGIYYRIFDK